MPIDELLEPIAEGAPCGEDLSFSTEFDEIVELRREDDASLPLGDWKEKGKDPKVADWPALCTLCEDLLRWVVAAGPMWPYAHVRSPIEAAALSICTVDLPKVRADTLRPDGVPEAVWPTVVAAAQRYREACPEQAMAADDMRLLEMRPEGQA